MFVRRLLSVFAVAILFSAVGSNANAQGFGGNGGFWGFGYGMPYSAYVLDAPPYFSMFPPVYYSHIVPRPYGFSPFAYPPGVMTPERIMVPTSQSYARYGRPSGTQIARKAPPPKPVIIENPFLLDEAERPKFLADGRPVPQIINLQDLPAASTARAVQLGQTGLDR